MADLLNDTRRSVAGRRRERETDITESHYLLLELGTQEPVMQHCIKTLQGICLAQGVKLKKKGVHDQNEETKQWDSQATTQFQDHIDKYFVPFCEEALRCFFICGFVPWHLRRLESTGDLVPEVLPLGTFTWRCALKTELDKQKEMQKASMARNHQGSLRISYLPAIVDPIHDRKGTGHWGNKWNTSDNTFSSDTPAVRRLGDGGEDDGDGVDRRNIGNPDGNRRVRMDMQTKYVQYRVHVTEGGMRDEEVFIYEYIPARYDISVNSVMYASVTSPISHLIVDYKNLRQAQIRRSHADAWNTQAHLITTYKPGSSNNNIPEWKGFNFGHQDRDPRTLAPECNPLAMLFDTAGENEVTNRDAIIKRQVIQMRPHDPVVYTLPKHTDVVQAADLKPVEDLPFLLEKYSR